MRRDTNMRRIASAERKNEENCNDAEILIAHRDQRATARRIFAWRDSYWLERHSFRDSRRRLAGTDRRQPNIRGYPTVQKLFQLVHRLVFFG